MKNQSNRIGDYSSSPTGQGCLWAAALGVMGVLGLSYLSAYTGTAREPLDRIENGIAGLSRPTAHHAAQVARLHRRHKRRRIAERIAE